MYIITQSRKVINNQYFFQRLNPSRIVLRTNTCKEKNSYYISRRVVKANKSEVYLILIRVSKCEVHVISKVKEYIIPEVVKSKLIKLNSISKLTLVIVSCSKNILSKFKAVKFTFK